jgi:hypothetical protein
VGRLSPVAVAFVGEDARVGAVVDKDDAEVGRDKLILLVKAMEEGLTSSEEEVEAEGRGTAGLKMYRDGTEGFLASASAREGRVVVVVAVVVGTRVIGGSRGQGTATVEGRGREVEGAASAEGRFTPADVDAPFSGVLVPSLRFLSSFNRSRSSLVSSFLSFSFLDDADAILATGPIADDDDVDGGPKSSCLAPANTDFAIGALRAALAAGVGAESSKSRAGSSVPPKMTDSSPSSRMGC